MSPNVSKLEEFTGQESIKERLKVAIEAANNKDKPLKHILFYGPPGLGKTTLAKICSNEAGVRFHKTNGGSIKKADVDELLISMRHRDILFIDEIHRLNPHVEEKLYPALQDFELEIKTDKKLINFELDPFTIIGATTKKGNISNPLLDRFTYKFRLTHYELESLTKVVLKICDDVGVNLTESAAKVVAKRSAGTPRKVVQTVKYLADWQACYEKTIRANKVTELLQQHGIYKQGLDDLQKRTLKFLYKKNKAKSLSAISGFVGTKKKTIEENIEPYLLRKNFMEKTSRGRKITEKGTKLIISIIENEPA